MAKTKKIRKKKESPIIQIFRIYKNFPSLVEKYETKNDSYYVILNIKPTENSITYKIKFVASKSYKPAVYIISPAPSKLFKGLENIPHIYSRKEGKICLFYPDEINFNSDYSIIIPWISEWLFNFEIWKITGKWCGGGHEIPKKELSDS